MAHHLISSNATIKAIKAGDPRGRLNDGAGLYLRLFVKGGSHGWRFDYSLNGRRNTLSLGTYPDTGLSLARSKADEARKLVSTGTDPSGVRKEARDEIVRQREAEHRAATGLPPIDSFEAVAREWHSKNEPTWAYSHASKVIRRLELDVFPWIGAMPVSTIRPMDLLRLLKRIEERGAIETTHRVQQNCGQVFRYAVATARADSDPSRDLRGALTPWRPQHYPTLTDEREVGGLLRDIEAYEGGFITKCAMKLSPMLFVRPGELRRAEWSEINLDVAEWRIPAADEGPRHALFRVLRGATALNTQLRDLLTLARGDVGKMEINCGFYDRLPAARQAAAATLDLTQGALRAIALAHSVCPYYLGRELVRWSDVVVGDYNHYFDRSALLHGLTLVNQWRVALLVDEAHNLVERGRAMYSAELAQADLQAVRAGGPAVLKAPLARLSRA